MSEEQIIRDHDGNAQFVVLPVEEYRRLRELAEDATDAAAAYAARKRIDEGEELVPAEIANRLLDGENPVRVWREYRGISVKDLAAEAGLSQPYLSQIETGRREGTMRSMAAIARALRVDLDDLAPTAE